MTTDYHTKQFISCVAAAIGSTLFVIGALLLIAMPDGLPEGCSPSDISLIAAICTSLALLLIGTSVLLEQQRQSIILLIIAAIMAELIIGSHRGLQAAARLATEITFFTAQIIAGLLILFVQAGEKEPQVKIVGFIRNKYVQDGVMQFRMLVLLTLLAAILDGLYFNFINHVCQLAPQNDEVLAITIALAIFCLLAWMNYLLNPENSYRASVISYMIMLLALFISTSFSKQDGTIPFSLTSVLTCVSSCLSVALFAAQSARRQAIPDLNRANLDSLQKAMPLLNRDICHRIEIYTRIHHVKEYEDLIPALGLSGKEDPVFREIEKNTRIGFKGRLFFRRH